MTVDKKTNKQKNNPPPKKKPKQPVKHILIQMSTIHESFVSQSIIVFEIFGGQNLFKKCYLGKKYLTGRRIFLFILHRIDDTLSHP